MKAILVREFGGPDVLKLEEVPRPKPATGEVLVRIHAAGVNPYDTKCIPFRQKLVSAKVQESGSPMERRIMRCTTRRRRTLPKPFWCTVQAAAWVSQQYKSRAVWVS